MPPRRVALAVALLALAATGAALAADQGPDASPGPKDVRLVDVGDDGDRLWPYTSKHTDFGTRTLAINVIVHDDPDMVKYRLERRTDVQWAELNRSEETANFSVALSETRVGFDWTPAHGSMRYTYVERAGEGRWLPQRYQLHAGTYLGTRSHVRAYATGGNSEWTAIQAHGEYWDWFRLRHTVTDVWETGRHLEEDFADQPLVSDVERAYATQRGPTADGITVVHVAGVALLGAVPTVRRRLRDVAADVEFGHRTRVRSLALFAFAGGVPLFVRAAGIGLEQALPWLSPKVVAAPLYVLLVAGLPVGVHRLSDGVPARRAAALAGVGFLLGLALEAVAIGATAGLARFAWHRLLLAVALGAVAAGTRERGPRRAVLVAGVAAWSAGVVAAVLNLI